MTILSTIDIAIISNTDIEIETEQKNRKIWKTDIDSPLVSSRDVILFLCRPEAAITCFFVDVNSLFAHRVCPFYTSLF
jgi:hypothetical protein